MEDSALFDRGLGSLAASLALSARGAPDNRLLSFDGVTALVSPGAPDRSVVNSVAYETADALAAALGQVADAYEAAGVRAWTVWVPATDRRAAELLADAGHRLDASPQAMGFELDGLGEPAAPEPEWSGDWSALAEAALINDRAYGDTGGLWARAMGDLPEGLAHLYLARVDGEPASFVMVHDHEEDCGFWFAATVPEARGRGLAGGLLHRALLDARERGCTTTTTQATRMGAPVYERIGYRNLGVIEMWERRRPAER